MTLTAAENAAERPDSELSQEYVEMAEQFHDKMNKSCSDDFELKEGRRLLEGRARMYLLKGSLLEMEANESKKLTKEIDEWYQKAHETWQEIAQDYSVQVPLYIRELVNEIE